MRSSLRIASLTLVILAAGAVVSFARPKPHPLSGNRLLVLERTARVAVYAEPGVLRVAEQPAQELPFWNTSGGELLIPVAARRGEWLKIAYDDAGREGWVESRRSWKVLDWEEFLPGRKVRLFGGLKKELYHLFDLPDGKVAGLIGGGQSVRVIAAKGDWAQTEAGWLRWRDREGRLVVVLDAGGP